LALDLPILPLWLLHFPFRLILTNGHLILDLK